MSEEAKLNLSIKNKGKVVSQETKDKMSKSRKGHIVTEATKQKIKDTWKRKLSNNNFREDDT